MCTRRPKEPRAPSLPLPALAAVLACAALAAGLPSGVAAAERPNVLVVLADDLGYSDLGSYGGEIRTPHLDRLADEGLRFTQFYSAARCWPSRAALLTGYYPQQVRMDPVRREFDAMPPWARMLPEHLEAAGYRSYHSGKWHIMLEPRPLAQGRFARSYVLRDHDRFFAPRQHELDDEPLPPVAADEPYYATTAIADRMIEFLREHAAQHGERPWFGYLAFTAPHFPLHALPDDIRRYRGRYDAGWDVVRRERLERMRAAGLVPPHTRLPPLEPQVVPPWNMISRRMESWFGPIDERQGADWVRLSLDETFGPGEVGQALPWESLDEAQRAFQAAKMEIHAAMVDRMDLEIGRVLEQIEAMGESDNTLVVVLSDNGASAEIIVRGDMHDPHAPPGSAASYLSLGPGWSTASNSPFRLHKHWTHEGGAASPMIVHWPAGIPGEARGGLRAAPGHFVDLLPTLLELAGLDPADRPADAPPLAGRSLVPALAADVPIEREYLFWEHAGHRALRVGDWKAVSRDGSPDGWELYQLARDRNELEDLAAQHPQTLQQLVDRWTQLDRRFADQATRRYEGE